MKRKPPDRRQPTLFPPDPDDTPEPHDNATHEPDGGHHAVQDDHSRTAAEPAADARATPPGAEAALDDGTLRQGAESQPRSLEGNAVPDAAGQQPDPGHFGSAGDRPQGTGGSFALRVSLGHEPNAVPRRGDAVRPPSHAAR